MHEELTLEDYFKRLQRFREEKKENVNEIQIGGNHYMRGIQPFDIISSWKLDFWSGNVLKYLLRFPFKNGIEDLKKARHYLDYLIENYERIKKDFYK